MKIFITGSTGFVGRALSAFLTKQGHRVVGLVHNVELGDYNRLPSPPFSCMFGDIRDFKRMREILYEYKPDAIVHLAAQAIVSEACINPISTYDTNVSGTINLLEAWKEACPYAYFLHFSTDKVYGNGLGKKETDSLQVTYDTYQASKVAADLVAQGYGATVTRSCNIYGPGDKEPSRLVPSVIQSCLRGEKTSLRNPLARREWIYIDDICKLISWLLEKHKTGIWNLGSGQVLSAEEVTNIITKEFPQNHGYYASYPGYKELTEQSLDTSKLCSEIDCLAFTTLQAGIRKTVEAWRTQAPLLSC